MTRKKHKKPRTIKPVKSYAMSGRTIDMERDNKLSALKPGTRISKTGKKYTETRQNRSDLKKRKRK